MVEAWTPENMAKWVQEELHEDLVPYVCETVLGKSVKHPLIFDLGLFAPGLTNLQYLQKKAMLARAVEANDMGDIISAHERAYRLDALYNYVLERDGATGDVIPLWGQTRAVQRLAEFVWTDSENISQHHDEWLALYANRPEGEVLGNRKGFRKLPDKITVYRGGDPENSFISWTTQIETAKFFARRGGERVARFVSA